MENILVTGGAGYIGSHACKMLKKSGKSHPTAMLKCANLLILVTTGKMKQLKEG